MHCKSVIEYVLYSGMEKYSSGWRGAPAKGVGRLRGARVQIPPSPFKAQTVLSELFTYNKIYKYKKWYLFRRKNEKNFMLYRSINRNA